MVPLFTREARIQANELFESRKQGLHLAQLIRA